jgi:hypothetical protein
MMFFQAILLAAPRRRLPYPRADRDWSTRALIAIGLPAR